MNTNSLLFAPVITGIADGNKLTEQDLIKLERYRPYGVSLRTPNLDNNTLKPKAVKIQELQHLIDSIMEAYHTETKPIIWIDQEGEVVQRINPKNVGHFYYPAATEFSVMYQEDPELALKKVNDNYSNITKELLSFRIQGNFAPVTDIWYPDITSKVLEKRTFGNNVSEVIALTSAAFNAIIRTGGIPCLKHLPGHGRATSDSHTKLPIITASLIELETSEFLVMQALAKLKPPYVMLAHVIYTALDPLLPATFSSTVINYIRKVFGKDTKILTDAMDMQAAAVYGSPDEIALKALKAGVDIVLDYKGLCSIDFYEQILANKYLD